MSNRYKVGDKVVPIDKTMLDNLENSVVWARAQKEGQPYLYITGSGYGTSYICNSYENNHGGGDFFNEIDLVPYVELVNSFKYKVGDKIVPIDKTAGDSGIARSSTWKSAIEKNQPYLFVTEVDANDTHEYYSGDYACCVNINGGGDFFNESDLIPYIEQEETEVQTKNKIQITAEQKEALDRFIAHGFTLGSFVTYRTSLVENYNSLKDFTVDEFARLLYEPNSYEVTIPKLIYNVGDYMTRIEGSGNDSWWGKHRQAGYVFQVSRVGAGGVNDTKDHFHDEQNIRIATVEETKSFKEREYWDSFGREVGEFRLGDVFIDEDGDPFVLGVNEYVDVTLSEAEQCYREGNFKGLYPVESHKPYIIQ